MATQGPRWTRRIQAAESADRLLDELSIDQTQQVDVFGICEDLGLWLAFLPLDNLLGAYVPEGVGGVLVTTQRPIPIQRYTAAHEIGHWRLDHGHGLALDGEEHVLGSTPVEREQLAQVFAGCLLMPPPLVFGVLDRLGLTGQPAEPEHAYALAREAGVSYEAAVRQLAHLEVITPAEATALRQHRPLTVKAALALGRRPVNGYADVWPVNEDWNDQLLALRVEDEVVISLPENRSTGYRWMFPGDRTPVAPSPEPPPLDSAVQRVADPGAALALRERFAARTKPAGRAPRTVIERLRMIEPAAEAQVPSVAGVEVVGDEYIPARADWLPPRKARKARISSASTAARQRSSEHQASAVGGTGRRVLGVRFPTPGPATIRLQYQTPYNADEPVEEYVLHALVEPRPAGFSIDQLVGDSDEAWTAEVRQRQIEQPLVPLVDVDESDAGDDHDELTS